MTSEELKNNIVAEIKEIKDENALIIIKSIIDIYKETSLRISDKRKNILDEAKQQINDYKYFADEDVNKEEDSWLKKLYEDS